MSTIRVLVFAVIACLPGRSLFQLQAQSAQLPARSVGIRTSPVPLWPTDGVIPAELADRYVFYDVATEEYVVRYPENLGTPSFEQAPGPMVVERFATNRGSQPSISFSVTENQGKFKYSYRVANGEKARKPIMSWDLVMPSEPDGELTVPPLWHGAAMKSSINIVGNALGTPGGTGVLLSWYYMDERAPIAPGKALDTFSVVSSYKPGVSMGYVTSGRIESPPPDLPDQVKEQLGPALSLTFNRDNVLLIGPRFASATPRSRIAQDFQSGIRRMIAAGQLKEQSPAIREALDRLTPYAQNPEVFDNARLTLIQPAQDSVEAALLHALILAMN